MLEDDLNGGEADETVGFGLDGVSYEIDLSDKNAQKLRNALQRYVSASRRVGGRSARGRVGGAGSASADREQLAAIRAWGRANGYQVSERGRVSAALVEAYHAS